MNSSITVNDREITVITGVKSVESVTDTEIFLFTEKGDLIIKGRGLVSDEFDSANGIFRITGTVDQFSYTTDKYHLPDNLITRLFR